MTQCSEDLFGSHSCPRRPGWPWSLLRRDRQWRGWAGCGEAWPESRASPTQIRAPPALLCLVMGVRIWAPQSVATTPV